LTVFNSVAPQKNYSLEGKIFGGWLFGPLAPAPPAGEDCDVLFNTIKAKKF
jgi:hypothetical protein